MIYFLSPKIVAEVVRDSFLKETEVVSKRLHHCKFVPFFRRFNSYLDVWNESSFPARLHNVSQSRSIGFHIIFCFCFHLLCSANILYNSWYKWSLCHLTFHSVGECVVRGLHDLRSGCNAFRFLFFFLLWFWQISFLLYFFYFYMLSRVRPIFRVLKLSSFFPPPSLPPPISFFLSKHHSRSFSL